MRSRLLTTLLVGTMTLAACGGDDEGGDLQKQVADMLMADIGAEEDSGATVDEGCIRELAGQLSDSDAAAIIASEESDEEAEVSAEGQALGLKLIDCIEIDLGG